MEIQVENMVSNFGDCIQYKEIVQSSMEELISGSQEVQEEAKKILDSENLLEAQQFLLHHQVEPLSAGFPVELVSYPQTLRDTVLPEGGEGVRGRNLVSG
jgi:hypothetical protein